MRLRSILLLTSVVAAVCVVESSLLMRQSIFHPRLPEPCFTSRAEDRPFAYSVVAFLTRAKDLLGRLKSYMDNAKLVQLSA